MGATGLANPPPRSNPLRGEKELRARRVPGPRHRRARGTPPSRNQGGLRRGLGSSPATSVEGGSRATRRRRASGRRTRSPLGDWGGVRPPPKRGGEGRGPGAPRPPGPGGLQGPPWAGAGLCLRRLGFGKAPARVQDGGERVGSRALATRSGPALPALRRGEGRAPATPRAPRPRPGRRPAPPPATPRPSVPAAGVWRRPPAPPSAEPRPRQLQKMAAKAAPVATLPRAGASAAAPRSPAPLPSPGDSPPGRRDPGGQRVGAGGGGGERERARRPERGASGAGEGRLPAGGGARGGGRWQEAGAGREGALALPPSLHAPSPPGVAAPGWGNANGLLTSVTAGRPRPSRDPPASPPPLAAVQPGGPASTPPRRKMKIKLKAVRVPTTKRPKPGTPRRRSGWILGRHELQRRRELGRCRAPTLLSAGSRSPTPASAPPTAAPASGVPAAALRLPAPGPRHTSLGAKGSPGLGRGAPRASWRPRRELGTGPRGALERGKKSPPESRAWGSWGINEKCESRARG